MPTVYTAISADILHYGHINIIQNATKYGELTVGVLTDSAISTYKRPPLLPYESRKIIIENIKGVSAVIPQTSLDYEENLHKLRPDFVIHGTDWIEGSQSNIRKKVIETLKQWGGQLIEVKYTTGVSISALEESLRRIGTTPDIRRKTLKNLINMDRLVTVMEAHNGLTGLIVENTKHLDGEKTKMFDAMWISSLCDSTAKGKPDIELVDLTSRLNTINEIMEVTTKPIILDGDTGSIPEHFVYTVKTVERLGVSAIIIEDKEGLKKNSLFGTEVDQNQAAIEDFCFKISEGKKAQVTDEFMIIARIESLILKKGMDDAVSRAKAFIKAGADGIMIHSREKTVDEIKEFCEIYSKFDNKVPLVVVPTSFNEVTEDELKKMGVNIVIYANHLIRSAYPAMLNTAMSILKNGRSYECDKDLMPINNILELIDGGK